ncbi:MAG: Transport permease protein [uncultured Sulfurovum sp.]|uniref:Transport permease protein n=1 Tax=uncultured Sulfurovum sp. TaxID=269237 RepID=A0A6S6TRH0_9BACT|nr:MAG: Transport permease protein [uncultured Sulfurovum sp.]
MKKRSSLKIFLAVQNALFLRELNMRLSAGRLGLFWTFFEPFFQIIVFVLIKVLLFGAAESNFDFAVFLSLNFIAFNMFKNIVTKSSNAFGSNKALFVYKQVKPIDTMIARTLLEVFITAVIIIVFLILGFYFDFDMEVKDLSMVALGFFFLLFFSFSFALFVAVLSTFVESIGKVVGFMMTGLMFGSAIFYTIEMLPVPLQEMLLYNPLVHFIEMIHGFYFLALDDQFVSYTYMWLWSFSLLYMGLWLYIKLEKRIISL